MKKKGIKRKNMFEGGALFSSAFGMLCSIAIFTACLLILAGISLALETRLSAIRFIALFLVSVFAVFINFTAFFVSFISSIVSINYLFKNRVPLLFPSTIS